MTDATTSFYVSGGTLRPDAPSYLAREADHDLYQGLVRGEFCYVLTSRQMGKSSLMVRTASRLREQKVNVVALDLTAIGLNLTPEQWYDGLILRMGRQVRLEEPLEDFWLHNTRLSPVQRLFTAIREVAMPQRKGPFVIFVDEIDTVRSLPFSTDEFFAAIRECYNRRVEDPELNRLTFCLLGVATPSDLIRDTMTTPFNIGQRIELCDFSEEEAAPLAAGLLPATDPASLTQARTLLERVLYWTGGHPYLTQRLCRATAQSIRAGALVSQDSEPPSAVPPGSTLIVSPKLVDQLCEELFLSPRARERDDNLLFVRERILRTPTDLPDLLALYEQIRMRQRVRDDEASDSINHLRLAGITRVVNGFLQVRNRIYYRVFDRPWVRSQLAAATRSESPSIAVLPFVNMHPDKENEYLSDGITEDIITALSQVKGLRVPARTSAFVFKGKNQDIRKVGELLRVATVLEGSVRKGNKLRVTAQLINVADGYPIWSQRYDREMQDIFVIQDEISRSIVEALKVKLVQQGALVKTQTESTEAYQLYLKGRYYWNQREGGLRKAIHYFQLALLEDPKLALAYTGLADTYVMLGFYGYLPPTEALPKGKEAAEKALAIDETLGEAHSSLAQVIGYYDLEGGWGAAEKEYRRAIELNENYPPAHSWYALNLSLKGRHASAIGEGKQALELDPLSLPVHCTLGWVYYFAQLYDQALAILGSALDKNPYFMLARLILGHVYAITARYEEALNELEKAVAIAPGNPVPLSTLGYTWAMARRPDKARKIVEELKRLAEQEYVRSYLIGYVFNGLGELDEAFDWFERARQERDMWLPFINVDPAFDKVRNEPRFQSLLKSIGILEERLKAEG